ncbi:MAG: ABC transporter substrate-binding protein [Lachnospiraceae bacterium]|nr:ABC transporter substrate-binding protein [Lachnospiraceae bacterium]
MQKKISRREFLKGAAASSLALLSIVPSPEVTLASGVPEITLLAPKVDAKYFDGDLIAEALDSYVYSVIGAHIRLSFIESEKYERMLYKYEITDNLPDVFYIRSSSQIASLRESGSLLSLNSLLEENGQELKATIGDDAISLHSKNGDIYALPCLHDRAYRLSFEYRVRIAEDNGLNMDAIKDMTDLTEVFDELAELSPDIIACSETDAYQTWDSLSDNLGVLMDLGQPATVVNLYETAEYEAYCKIVYNWVENNYLLSDDTGMILLNKYVKSPEIFGKIANYHPGLPYVDGADAGEEIACVSLSESFLTTDFMKINAYAISSSSQHPEIAMQFLNLMYTDANVMNLLTYGIEGVHYQVIDEENGVIDYADGVTSETSGYAQFRSYFWGNQFLTYTWAGYPTDLWEQIQEYNDTALRSVAYGFTYDSSPVEAEVSACASIVDEYQELLQAGVGDPDVILAEFREKLKAAGIDTIIAEKQRQLDEYLAGE